MAEREDAVSREDAIDALEKWESESTWDEWCYDHKDEAEKYNIISPSSMVFNLPSAQPEPRWIPCNERLPEVGTYVIISKKALNFRSNLPSVCTAHRSCDPRSGKEEWNDMLFGKLDDDDVLAWLPLPEPYKEDTE